jgi:hypothetical protein
MKELKVGIPFPILLLRCYRNEFDSKTLVGQKPLVIYFIQKIIHQDVQLRLVVLEIYEDFKDLGASNRY